MAAATEQSVLRHRAAAKFERADAMLLTRDGLEQATSQAVAQHRAGRFREVGSPVLDLCCGIGGDLLAIGAVVAQVIGVDRDQTHAVAARHNAGVYGVDAVTVAADVTDLRLTQADAVFLDPARRTARGQPARRGGSEPPLEWGLSLSIPRVAIKSAPGVDLAAIPLDWEVEFVAVGRDLKEAVLWSPAWARSTRRATVLPSDGEAQSAELVPDRAAPSGRVHPPGRFLLDPSPAVTRAGAVADLAATLDAWQIDPRIAFLSAERPMPTPFGRWFEIEASLPFALKPLSAELRRLDVGAIDVRRRGLAGDVDDLRRRLRPTGSRRATVVLTRVINNPWAFICIDVPGT